MDAPVDALVPDAQPPIKHLRGRGRSGLRGVRGLHVLLAAVVVSLLVVGAVGAWYLLERKPLSELPGLTKEKVPQYAFSIYGITRPIGVAVSPSGERIYVTESEGTRQVQIYDRAGKKNRQPPAA